MGLFSFLKRKNKKEDDERVEKKKIIAEDDDDGQAQFLKDEPTAMDKIADMKKNGAAVIMESSEGKTRVYTADGSVKSEDEPAVIPGDKVIIQGQKRPISGVYLGNSLSVLKGSGKASEAKTETATDANAAPAPKAEPVKATEKKVAPAPKAEPAKATEKKVAPAPKKAEEKAEPTEVKAGKTGRFEIKKAKDGRYVFNLYAPNHVIVATSQVYTTTGAAVNGIKSIIANAAKAPIEDQSLKNYAVRTYPKWELYVDKGGQYRFRLNAPNGSCIVHSQGYTSKSSCKNGIESIIRCSANPEIDKSYLKKE